jgi:heterodisulfide reductase subunit C
VTSGVLDPGLSDKLRQLGAFDAERCMSCGICTAICPMGISTLPRRVMRLAALGLEDEVRAQREAIFSCLLCRACEVSCPAGVHIADNVRLLRSWLLRGEL